MRVYCNTKSLLQEVAVERHQQQHTMPEQRDMERMRSEHVEEMDRLTNEHQAELDRALSLADVSK